MCRREDQDGASRVRPPRATECRLRSPRAHQTGQMRHHSNMHNTTRLSAPCSRLSGPAHESQPTDNPAAAERAIRTVHTARNAASSTIQHALSQGI